MFCHNILVLVRESDSYHLVNGDDHVHEINLISWKQQEFEHTAADKISQSSEKANHHETRLQAITADTTPVIIKLATKMLCGLCRLLVFLMVLKTQVAMSNIIVVVVHLNPKDK